MRVAPISSQPGSALRERVATAVVLLGGLLLALFALPAAAWTALCALLLALAAWEWANFAPINERLRVIYAAAMTIAGALIANVAGLAGGSAGGLILAPAYVIALSFWLVVVPVALRRRPPRRPRVHVLAYGVLVLLPTFLALVQLRNMHPVMLLLFMATVWIADIAAYFVGRRFGRRKLAPRISPGKTWEGLAGALAATAVYALVWILLLDGYAPAVIRDLPASGLWMFLLIEALTVLSVLGDLFESAMKREAGLKDSGALLPGHGGLLDRIDALTPVLPAAALVSMMI